MACCYPLLSGIMSNNFFARRREISSLSYPRTKFIAFEQRRSVKFIYLSHFISFICYFLLFNGKGVLLIKLFAGMKWITQSSQGQCHFKTVYINYAVSALNRCNIELLTSELTRSSSL